MRCWRHTIWRGHDPVDRVCKHRPSHTPLRACRVQYDSQHSHLPTRCGRGMPAPPLPPGPPLAPPAPPGGPGASVTTTKKKWVVEMPEAEVSKLDMSVGPVASIDDIEWEMCIAVKRSGEGSQQVMFAQLPTGLVVLKAGRDVGTSLHARSCFFLFVFALYAIFFLVLPLQPRRCCPLLLLSWLG